MRNWQAKIVAILMSVLGLAFFAAMLGLLRRLILFGWTERGCP